MGRLTGVFAQVMDGKIQCIPGVNHLGGAGHHGPPAARAVDTVLIGVLFGRRVGTQGAYGLRNEDYLRLKILTHSSPPSLLSSGVSCKTMLSKEWWTSKCPL